MPGLFGIFESKKYVFSEHVFGALKSNMPSNAGRYFGQEVNEDKIKASSCDLNTINLDGSHFANTKLYIWVHGEAYNLDYVCQQNDLSNISFCELLDYAYQSNNLRDVLAQIDGYYCAVIFDRITCRTHLISDRLGTRMLYWRLTENGISWCSHMTPLFKADYTNFTLNTKAIDSFLNIGFLVEEQTWFKHIKLIRPSTILSFDPEKNRLKEERYWSWSCIRPKQISFDDAVNELGRLFINAVSRRFNTSENIGVSLSGGLDSRAILAAIIKLEPDYNGVAYTFGIKGSQDEEIAKQVISKTGWRHVCFHVDKTNWLDRRLEAVPRTDGMLDLQHMHGIEFSDQIKELVDINMNGYLGDMVLGGQALTKRVFDTRINIENAKQYYKNQVDQCDLNFDFYNFNKIEAHLYINRVRRFTNMGTVNQLDYIEQRKPFIDNELLEFVFSLPDKYRYKNQLYSKMLVRFFPTLFRDIRWQSTGHNLTTNRYLYGYQIFKQRAQKKLRPYCPKLFNNSEYTDYASWIREEESFRKISSVLSKSSPVKYLIQMDGLTPLEHLSEHCLNGKNNSDFVLRALTLQQYFHDIYSDLQSPSKF